VLDDKAVSEVITESRDVHSDAIKAAHATREELTEVRAERRSDPVNPDEITRFNLNRRSLLASLGLGGGAAAARAALPAGMAAALTALLARPAAADRPLDVQILQTASSLEILAVSTYGAALGLDFIKNGNPVVVKFAETTMSQHNEHKQAFQAQTKTLGGTAQTNPNPKFVPVVEQAKPNLKTPLDVVNLAVTLEDVATQTYLQNISLLDNSTTKALMASVMGVETQHAATLRAVKALLEANMPELIKIPIGADVAKLPAAAGSASFPNAFEPVGTIAEPETGAVK
jgi:Ferritin-like domain